jgi:hypothetical protein
MNSTAYAFFKFARENYSLVRQFRLETDGGYLTMDDVPILPVYLVPAKKSFWLALAALLTDLVADYVQKDWLETATATYKIPEWFTEKWCEVLKKGGASDSEMEDPDDTRMGTNARPSLNGVNASGGG